MYTQIDEQVGVEAFFSGGRVTPRRFIWNGREITLLEITQSWEERRGLGRKIRFAACDGQSVFSLSFDPGSLNWNLEGISDGF